MIEVLIELLYSWDHMASFTTATHDIFCTYCSSLTKDIGCSRVFQFIQRLFSEVEVRAFCRPLEFFHCNLDKLCPHGARFVQGVLSCWNIYGCVNSSDGIVMLQHRKSYNCVLPALWQPFWESLWVWQTFGHIVKYFPPK